VLIRWLILASYGHVNSINMVGIDSVITWEHYLLKEESKHTLSIIKEESKHTFVLTYGLALRALRARWLGREHY
jgi:hypothetical protein